jgi:hypothetical protein
VNRSVPAARETGLRWEAEAARHATAHVGISPRGASVSWYTFHIGLLTCGVFLVHILTNFQEGFRRGPGGTHLALSPKRVLCRGR